jgi:hypothetical protein
VGFISREDTIHFCGWASDEAHQDRHDQPAGLANLSLGSGFLSVAQFIARDDHVTVR